jgi:hypothetical protein
VPQVEPGSGVGRSVSTLKLFLTFPLLPAFVLDTTTSSAFSGSVAAGGAGATGLLHAMSFVAEVGVELGVEAMGATILGIDIDITVPLRVP